MLEIININKQRTKDFYNQLPDKVDSIKTKIDNTMPEVMKNSTFVKDSGLIVSALTGILFGLILGVMMGITLFTTKSLSAFTLFLVIHCIIGLFKKHYTSNKNDRKIDVINTLLFTELMIIVPVFTISTLSNLF